MCASAQAENLARYLNGSHFRVCAAISQKLPSPCRQTDTYADRQADRLGGWVGDGLRRLAPLKVMSCLKLRTDDCRHSRNMCRGPRGKITTFFTCREFSV